jgi:hypothetical protein
MGCGWQDTQAQGTIDLTKVFSVEASTKTVRRIARAHTCAVTLSVRAHARSLVCPCLYAPLLPPLPRGVDGGETGGAGRGRCQTKPFMFEVATKQRVFLISATAEDEMNDWIAAIQGVLATLPPPQDDQAPDDGAAAVADDD